MPSSRAWWKAPATGTRHRGLFARSVIALGGERSEWTPAPARTAPAGASGPWSVRLHAPTRRPRPFSPRQPHLLADPRPLLHVSQRQGHLWRACTPHAPFQTLLPLQPPPGDPSSASFTFPKRLLPPPVNDFRQEAAPLSQRGAPEPGPAGASVQARGGCAVAPTPAACTLVRYLALNPGLPLGKCPGKDLGRNRVHIWCILHIHVIELFCWGFWASPYAFTAWKPTALVRAFQSCFSRRATFAGHRRCHGEVMQR
jgi:hypothetical protein